MLEGVWKNDTTGKWCVCYTTIDTDKLNFGEYDTFQSAVEVYNQLYLRGISERDRSFE